jgi:hypothetical protein
MREYLIIVLILEVLALLPEQRVDGLLLLQHAQEVELLLLIDVHDLRIDEPLRLDVASVVVLLDLLLVGVLEVLEDHLILAIVGSLVEVLHCVNYVDIIVLRDGALVQEGIVFTVWYF